MHFGNASESVSPLKPEPFLFGKSISVALLAMTIAATLKRRFRTRSTRRLHSLSGKDALILGAFTLGTVAVAPLDMAVAKRLQYPWVQENRFLKTSATGFRLLAVPGSLITGAALYGIGRADGQRRLQALGLHSVESILHRRRGRWRDQVCGGTSTPVSSISTIPPIFSCSEGSQDDQVPLLSSGHTINAFAFASTLTREVQFWYPHSAFYVGTVFYGGATLMGLSRIYNNQHWASDVMGGAAIGTLIGVKVVKFTHSHPGNHIDRELIKGKSGSQTRSMPLVFSFQF